MGKSRRSKKGRKSKAASEVLGSRQNAAVAGARQQTTLLLLQKLDSSNPEERLEACISLGNLFSGIDEHKNKRNSADEDDQDIDMNGGNNLNHDGLGDFERQRQVLQVLLNKGAFKILMKRISDPDAQIRFHTCGLLCSITAVWKPVVEVFAKDGIHVPALALVKNFSRDETSQEKPETVLHALFLLCEICGGSSSAVNAASNSEFILALCELIKQVEGRGSIAMAETASRLLYLLSDSNRTFANSLVSHSGSLSLIEELCNSNDLEAKSAQVSLHCIGALVTASVLAGDAMLLDPAKVFSRAIQLCITLWNAEPADGQLRSQILELLTNCCSKAMFEDGDEEKHEGGRISEQEEFENLSIERIADAIAESTFRDVLARIFHDCATRIESSDTRNLTSLGCGLLDNIVQNASSSQILKLGLVQLWQSPLNLITELAKKISNSNIGESNIQEETEDLAVGLSALMWSIARRSLAMSQQFSPSKEEFSRILEFTALAFLPSTRANLVGILGVIGQGTGDSDILRKASRSLLTCTCDGSRLVSVTAMDSLIDVFADDSKHSLYMELNVGSALRAASKRHKSLAGEKNPTGIDPIMLAGTLENCAAFLDYKRSQ